MERETNEQLEQRDHVLNGDNERACNLLDGKSTDLLMYELRRPFGRRDAAGEEASIERVDYDAPFLLLTGFACSNGIKRRLDLMRRAVATHFATFPTLRSSCRRVARRAFG